MRDHFHLFVYGSLRRGGSAATLLASCEWITAAEVGGVLYDIDGAYMALVLYGNTPVAGEIWRCPSELLPEIDAYEGVDDGLFRRVGVKARQPAGGEVACWTYVAGPAVARKLTPARRR
jgi:gamma-glutamylcyclotransferase (GGCT)/AIG2-like uncharacterized protein YtfP